jgi:hypothetical protein
MASECKNWSALREGIASSEVGADPMAPVDLMERAAPADLMEGVAPVDLMEGAAPADLMERVAPVDLMERVVRQAVNGRATERK